jgi:cell division protease FtsH
MNQTSRTVLFWAVIAVSAFLLWQVVRASSEQKSREISYSRFLSDVAAGQVSKVIVAGRVVRGFDKSNSAFRVIAPANQDGMISALQQHEVEIWFEDVPEGNWTTWITNLAPLVLLAALWYFMIRQLQKGSKLRSIAQSGGATESPGAQPSRFGP